MSYLDDPDHEWAIDPSSQVNHLDLDQVLTDLCDRFLNPHRLGPPLRDTEIKLIVQGAMELARRTNAPLAQCLDTSMIWFYG